MKRETEGIIPPFVTPLMEDVSEDVSVMYICMYVRYVFVSMVMSCYVLTVLLEEVIDWLIG